MSSLPAGDMPDGSSPAALNVCSSIALKPLISHLETKLQAATGVPSSINFLASPAVQREVRRGAACDVVISNPNIIDEMIDEREIAPESRVNIARSTVGVVAKCGARKYDVSTVEGFRKALRSAASIAHSDGGVGRIFLRMLDQMGVRDEVQHKLKVVPAFSGAEVVARGEAEIAFLITVAVAGIKGVELVGVPPEEFSPHVSFAGGVSTRARNPKAAAAFLSVLSATENDAVLESIGMTSIPS